MRILVCGGRHYSDWPKVRQVLGDLCDKHSALFNPTDNWLPSDIVIMTGACPTGADDLAALSTAGAAGPIRNQQMLDDGKPDLVVAFPGGKGTADMVRRARVAGIPTIEA